MAVRQGDDRALEDVLARVRVHVAHRKPFTLAVAGHRWNKLRPEQALRLEAALTAIFREIDRNADSIDIILAMGMAEGTDLLAASLMPTRWRLRAMLPLPATDWREWLANKATGNRAAAVAQFDAAMRRPLLEIRIVPARSNRDPDFSKLAAALVAGADVLVAVWDGKAGLPGGTGDVVRLAREAGLPVIDLLG